MIGLYFGPARQISLYFYEKKALIGPEFGSIRPEILAVYVVKN